MDTTKTTERDTDLGKDGIQTLTLHDFTTVWAVHQAKLAWLVGAGISASAGVPLASSIRDRLLFDRYAAEAYQTPLLGSLAATYGHAGNGDQGAGLASRQAITGDTRTSVSASAGVGWNH